MATDGINNNGRWTRHRNCSETCFRYYCTKCKANIKYAFDRFEQLWKFKQFINHTCNRNTFALEKYGFQISYAKNEYNDSCNSDPAQDDELEQWRINFLMQRKQQERQSKELGQMGKGSQDNFSDQKTFKSFPLNNISNIILTEEVECHMA